MKSLQDLTKAELIHEIEQLQKQMENLQRDLKNAVDKAEAANHIKAMFLANISHEIRTPMNGIIGMYNVLKQTDLTDEQREFLDIINISGQNLLTIIDDIIDLSKIESGQLILDKKPFTLKEEINKIVTLLSIKAKGKNIDLKTDLKEEADRKYIGDAARLRQIITNLTNNAIKYTKEGSVTIRVEPSVTNDTIQELKFSIIDTGIGISKEGIEKLFKAFSQLDSSSTRKYGGTGLGLAIAKNLSNLMNGEIGVESEEGKGSVFWFTASFEMLQKDEKGSMVNQEVEKTASETDNLNILLVEDNLLNQKFATATLKKEGHHVDIAENGKIAVEKYKQHDYDLILMDIQMPVMDGMEATHEIRAYEEKNNKERIKIIAITAYVMERDRKMCLNAGMDEYLAKPFKPQELIDLIDKVYFNK
ncbi:MAG: response regulator [Bacteroidales bacterium]|nr:response regulator [Bacteroidales bacterium]MCF8388205.1 response regulator [Bacteroidales bacterium]MCF8399019.1 response regulator [Bacteroidales bacterium]